MQRTRAALGRLAPLVAAAATLTPVASSQAIQLLFQGGDPIPGAPGTVSNILDVSIADDGQYVVRVSMATASGTFETAVLNGAAVLNEGDDLFDPPGLRVDRFDDIWIGPGNTLWWNIDTSATATSDLIMYRNLVMTGREGDAMVDPSQASGTVWKDFDGFHVSDDGDLLILGDVDSPIVTGTSEGVLVLQTFDDAGQLESETTLVMEGDDVPGSFDQVVDVGTNTGAHDVAVSNDHWIAYVRNDGGSNGDEMIYFDGQVVAREGQTGPEIGTTWLSLSSNAVDVDNSGDFIFRGTYQIIGGDSVNAIFKNGLPFLSQGDTSDSLAPHALAEFGSNTPILIGENGNIVYYGKTDNNNTAQDEAYFLNDRYLVRENITQIGSQVLGNLVTGPNGLDMSPNGRWVIFEAFFGDGTNAAFLIDLGLIREMEACGTNAGTLRHVDGLPLLGETVTFQMDGEQDFGVTPFFLLSNAPIVGWPPCGLTTPFGELLIDISTAAGNPGLALVGPPSDFGPVDFVVDVPIDMNLLGTTFYAQGLWWDIGDQTSAVNFRFTNGLEIFLAPR